MVELKNLHIGYKKLLFKVENLKLETGQLVSVIGPNGSGKTTFLNTILGITPSLGGDLIIDNKSLTDLKKEEKVRLFSHVPSKFEGVANLSVYDLIALGRAPYTNFLNKLKDSDRVVIDKVIKQLNLTDLTDSFTFNISDGERQIAMIGKAMAQETKIIVLDEPTAFLDYSNRKKIMRLLSKIAKENNKLILLSTHNLELCLEFSQLILAVDGESNSLRVYTNEVDKEKLISEVFGD